MMAKTFSATDARIHFGEVLRSAQLEPILIERDGKPEVVIISKESYDKLIAASSSPRELLQMAHKLVREDLSRYGNAERRHSIPAPEDILTDLQEEQNAG